MKMEYEEILELLAVLAEKRSMEFVRKQATEEEIQRYFDINEIALPDELKHWLQICNGTSMVHGGVFGINQKNNYCEIKENYYDPIWKHCKWVPIASDQCGDIYVIDGSVKNGDFCPVYFLDQSDFCKPDYVVGSSLSAFLRFKIIDSIIFESDEEDYWPFNKDRVIQEDPNIIHCQTAPLPWEAD